MSSNSGSTDRVPMNAGISNVRNCDLILLARSDLKLRNLVIGRNTMLTHGRARITNLVHSNTSIQFWSILDTSY